MDECISKYMIFNGNLIMAEELKDISEEKGISLYEVIRVIQGVPLFLEDHLKRLENSAKLTEIQLKFTIRQIMDFLGGLIKANSIEEGNIKIIFDHGIEDRFFAYFIKHSYPSKELYTNGVDTIFYHGERQNPNAKVINQDFRTVVNEKITETKVYEAILVDNNGNITEGSRSNIFSIKGDTIYTAPLKTVLPGVTRDRIINLLLKLNIKVEEKNIYYKDFLEMDALFITGTSPKVLPIRTINQQSFNSSSNFLLTKIITEYDNLIEKYIINGLNSNI